MMAEGITLALGRKNPLPFILSVDSHGSYSTIKTLHDGQDYRLRPTVSRMRDSFENKENHCDAVDSWSSQLGGRADEEEPLDVP